MSAIQQLLNTIPQHSKSNKYRVIINTMTDKLNILCTNTSLKGMQSTPVEAYYRGRRALLRGETQYDTTWTIEFYNNVDLGYRYKFLEWMRDMHKSRPYDANKLEQAIPSGMLSSVKNVFGNIKGAIDDVKEIFDDPMGVLLGTTNAAYQGSIKVYQLDNNGNEQYHQELVGAFPIDVSDVEYDDSNPEITKTTVTFAFTDIIFDNER
jgi:hypothetical protein